MITKDDNELVREVIDGNISSFEILIERYQNTIFNLIFRMTGNTENAKDITQDVFIKAFEKIHSFQFKYKFFSWLYRIAINETINWTKKNPRMESIQESWQIPVNDSNPDEAEQRGKILQFSLKQLPEHYRTLLLLKYYCGLSYEEVAEIKGISVKKVRSRLFMAREQLRKTLVINGLQ